MTSRRARASPYGLAAEDAAAAAVVHLHFFSGLSIEEAAAALAGIRGEQALRALPEAERTRWDDFWSAVQKHLRDEDGP